MLRTCPRGEVTGNEERHSSTGSKEDFSGVGDPVGMKPTV